MKDFYFQERIKAASISAIFAYAIISILCISFLYPVAGFSALGLLVMAYYIYSKIDWAEEPVKEEPIEETKSDRKLVDLIKKGNRYERNKKDKEQS